MSIYVGTGTSNLLSQPTNQISGFGGTGGLSQLNDTVADSFFAGLGNDTMVAGATSDVLWGNGGSDSLNGGVGNDTIIGDDGQASLYARIGTGQFGAIGGPNFMEPVFSADGRVMAFATNNALVAGDTNSAFDVYTMDMLTGAVTRASLNSSGLQLVGGTITDFSLSGDGTRVAFSSTHTNAHEFPDTNGVSDVFVRDLVTGQTLRQSSTATGVQLTDASTNAVLSDDGRTIYFSTAAALVGTDTNGVADVYAKTLSNGALTLISRTSAGGNTAGGGSFVTDVWEDGRVLFTSTANNIVSGDTNGEADVFLYNPTLNMVTRVSVTTAGAQGTGTAGNQLSQNAKFSVNGEMVVFESRATFVGGNDANNTWDVYVRNLSTNTTTLASALSGGQAGNGESRGGTFSPDAFTSTSGSVIFSSTANNLIVGDTNSLSDVFVKSLSTNQVERVSVNAAGAELTAASHMGTFSADGRAVFFSESNSLVAPDDTTVGSDIFLRAAAAGAGGPTADDNLIGGVGNDWLDGGIGTDTAQFAGNRTAYDFTPIVNASGVRLAIADEVGTDGTDTLGNIERLFFAGGNEFFQIRGLQQIDVSNMDGGRFDDVVFRNTATGQVGYFDATASGVSGFNTVLGSLPAGWVARVTADVSADGRADTFVQNTANGATYFVNTATGTPVWGTVSANLTADWRLVDVGDFTGDGVVDALFRNDSTGFLVYADMNQGGTGGAQFGAWANAANLGTGWATIGTGDFDRDGLSDLLVQNTTTGVTYYADLNTDTGGGITWGFVAGGLGTTWVARAIGDLNGDGHDDVVYTNQSTGAIWWVNMTGGSNAAGTGWGVVANGMTGWNVRGVADVENDGYADVIVQNAAGLTYYADMGPSGFNAWGNVANVGTDWIVV